LTIEPPRWGCERLQHAIADVEGALEIDVHHLIEIGFLDREQRLGLDDTGAVDEAVDPTAGIQHLLHHLAALTAVGDVAAIARHSGLAGLIPTDRRIERIDTILIHAKVHGGDDSPVFGEQFRRSKADPALG
jgi:hypothetical protein